MWFILFGLVACVVATVYIYVKQCQSHFQKKGIPGPAPSFFIGNCGSLLFGKETFTESVHKVYRHFPNDKYVGFYKMLTPAVVIRDPDLVTQILVKDFQHFANNEMLVDEKVDFIMSKNLFFMRDHAWKVTRPLISPMFSGGKLKHIFPISEQISQRLTTYLRQQIAEKKNKCIDGKRLCYKFTIDNVATTAFGIDAKAFEGETKFSEAVNNFNNFSFINAMKFLLLFLFPKLNNQLKIKFFEDDIEEYLSDVISQALKYRQENNVVRNDFLDHINSLKTKSVEIPFTHRDVVAQGAGFFVDGVETSSGVSSWVLFSIARYPEVQRKVREEINAVKAANNGAITYDALNSLTYLDAVINETLRMDNPIGVLFKSCTKTYTFPEVSDANKSRLTVNPGDSIIIPVDGLHYNPEFFPEPDTFKPERFFNENKDNLVKNAYMPFGVGPRFCVGMRFGLLQVKLIVVSVIGNFQLDVNDKMWPLKTHPQGFLKTPLNGFWFDVTELPKDD